MTGNIYRDIIITGSVGESGALRMAGENRDKIRKRFPGHVIREIEKKYESDGKNPVITSPEDIEDILCKYSTGKDLFTDILTIDVGEKGLMTALWDLGEKMGTGFRTDAGKIPVSPLTVEICELFGEDPFKTESSGCFLICTDRGNKLCDVFGAKGIPAALIGHSERGRGKIMEMGEITRFIDKPRHNGQ